MTMKLLLRVKEAEREGKRFKHFLLLCWLNVVMPTPALGFISGSLASAVLLIVFRSVLAHIPLVGAFIIGLLIVFLALIWQSIYDGYWEGEL